MKVSDLIVILGPTASGKTKLAARVALQLNGEIISADSRQVYRRLNIGTGKDLFEYEISNEAIAYHLIDIKDVGESYDLSSFQKDCYLACQAIKEKNKTPILCGGSALYIHSILHGFHYTDVPQNQDLRRRMEGKTKDELILMLQGFLSSFSTLADISTKKRVMRAIEISLYLKTNSLDNKHPDFSKSPVFGILLSREERRYRISQRLSYRLQNGLVEEVEGLLRSGVSVDILMFYGLEYKFITLYLIGSLSYTDMINRLEAAIHQFSKRQMTYFRKMEREGIRIMWIDGKDSPEDQASQVIQFCQDKKFVEKDL